MESTARLAIGILALLPLAVAQAGAELYEIRGRIEPPSRGIVYLSGSLTPYSANTEAGPDGRFRFRKLEAGPYTLSIILPHKGEWRATVQVGPSTADPGRRVSYTANVQEGKLVPIAELSGRLKVSARELSIPDSARREYDRAQRDLERRNIPAAIARLEKAVEIAPQYVMAWNNLGTIAYQTRQYELAGKHFRRALEEDPEAYSPLVNLGGVLLNLGNPEEALGYNKAAVAARPNDALAHSQLGMTYYLLGNFDQALPSLQQAKEIDPAHFSRPQLLLAEIYARRAAIPSAVAELEDYLRRHPDAENATNVRENITNLKKQLR